MCLPPGVRYKYIYVRSSYEKWVINNTDFIHRSFDSSALRHSSSSAGRPKTTYTSYFLFPIPKKQQLQFAYVRPRAIYTDIKCTSSCLFRMFPQPFPSLSSCFITRLVNTPNYLSIKSSIILAKSDGSCYLWVPTNSSDLSLAVLPIGS